MTKLYGKNVADLDALTSLVSLEDDIKQFTELNQLGYTKLIPDLGAGDPDDAFSSVPYEKGFNFLYYLETVVGGSEAFKGFIKAYVEKFGGITLTSNDFKNFYIEYFQKEKPDICLDSIEWNSWLYGEGGVLIKNNFDDSLVEQVRILEQKVLSDKEYSKDDIKEWKPAQIVVLLDNLLQTEEGVVDVRMLRKMERSLEFSKTNNSEIKFRWWKLGLRADWDEILEDLLEFITSQGRMKFIRPLYRALHKSKVGNKLAYSTFLKNDIIYHPICRKMIRKDFGAMRSKKNHSNENCF